LLVGAEGTSNSDIADFPRTSLVLLLPSRKDIVWVLGQPMHVVHGAPVPTRGQKPPATLAKDRATILEPDSDGEQPVCETVRSVGKHSRHDESTDEEKKVLAGGTDASMFGPISLRRDERRKSHQVADQGGNGDVISIVCCLAATWSVVSPASIAGESGSSLPLSIPSALSEPPLSTHSGLRSSIIQADRVKTRFAPPMWISTTS
jgi:hypothetical protein